MSTKQAGQRESRCSCLFFLTQSTFAGGELLIVQLGARMFVELVRILRRTWHSCIDVWKLGRSGEGTGRRNNEQRTYAQLNSFSSSCVNGLDVHKYEEIRNRKAAMNICSSTWPRECYCIPPPGLENSRMNSIFHFIIRVRVPNGLIESQGILPGNKKEKTVSAPMLWYQDCLNMDGNV